MGRYFVRSGTENRKLAETKLEQQESTEHGVAESPGHRNAWSHLDRLETRTDPKLHRKEMKRPKTYNLVII